MREVIQFIVVMGSAVAAGLGVALGSLRFIRRPLRWFEQITLMLTAMLATQFLIAVLRWLMGDT